VKARKIIRPEFLIIVFLGLFAAGALAAYAPPPVPGPTSGPVEPAARGAEIFQRERCFFCHSLRDNPPAVPRVTFSLGYLERLTWQWVRNGPDLNHLTGARTDDWLLAHLVEPGAIIAGCPMPSYAFLPDADLQTLVAYIRQANPEPAAVPLKASGLERPSLPATRQTYLAGRALYATYCEGCHGRNGNGAGAIGHLLQPEPRNLTDAAWMSKRDDDYLFRIIASGKPDTAMPAYEAIFSGNEMASVLFYLKFFADPSARQAMEEGFFQ
jgi:cbb3-type cytochrome oxidase cytochrome c subunit